MYDINIFIVIFLTQQIFCSTKNYAIKFIFVLYIFWKNLILRTSSTHTSQHDIFGDKNPTWGPKIEKDVDERHLHEIPQGK